MKWLYSSFLVIACAGPRFQEDYFSEPPLDAGSDSDLPATDASPNDVTLPPLGGAGGAPGTAVVTGGQSGQGPGLAGTGGEVGGQGGQLAELICDDYPEWTSGCTTEPQTYIEYDNKLWETPKHPTDCNYLCPPGWDLGPSWYDECPVSDYIYVLIGPC